MGQHTEAHIAPFALWGNSFDACSDEDLQEAVEQRKFPDAAILQLPEHLSRDGQTWASGEEFIHDYGGWTCTLINHGGMLMHAIELIGGGSEDITSAVPFAELKKGPHVVQLINTSPYAAVESFDVLFVARTREALEELKRDFPQLPGDVVLENTPFCQTL